MDSRLIFIGGAPRSGTSLIQKMLGFHSDVFAGPEFDHLPELMRLYRSMLAGIENGRQKAFYGPDFVRDTLSQFVASLLVRTADELGKRLVSEKTPDNVLVFNELAEVFDQAKFIFMVRDPRAIVHSMRQVAARAKAKRQATSVGNLQADLAWIDRATAAGDAFAARRPEQCLTVHYESLVSNPERTVRELCKFLRIEFQEAMLQTDRRNDFTAPIVDADRVWYTPEMYNRKVDSTSADAWREGLAGNLALMIEDYFARRRYKCHERYQLRRIPRHASALRLRTAIRYNLAPRILSRAARLTQRARTFLLMPSGRGLARYESSSQ